VLIAAILLVSGVANSQQEFFAKIRALKAEGKSEQALQLVNQQLSSLNSGQPAATGPSATHDSNHESIKDQLRLLTMEQALVLRDLNQVDQAEVAFLSLVEPPNQLSEYAAFELAVGCGSLIPVVELLPDDGGEAGIVQMRSAVPYAVTFANGNVIHLHRDVMVQAVLPDVGVSVPGDGEGRRTPACVFNYIKAGVVHRGEVEFRIDVTQPGR